MTYWVALPPTFQLMPIYEYQSKTQDASCAFCQVGFERLQKLADATLLACPECHSPVRRVISAPNLQTSNKDAMKPKNVEKNGFTQYRKVGKGQYEKTAGKGPRNISA